MKLLLDTHVFLWLNDNPKQLSQTAHTLCRCGEHDFYFSVAAVWEMQIKNQLGKLTLTMPIAELVNKNQQENNIQLLPIALPHISHLEQLPSHHKDPFDRIMIAQAMIENMTVVTADPVFADYSVSIVW